MIASRPLRGSSGKGEAVEGGEIVRLWGLHPKYLDPRGLVALWREALLAQAVLMEKLCGYAHHPQLNRFRESPSPLTAIAYYLQEVHAEACRRDYRFDADKFTPVDSVEPLPVTQGQLEYEWAHLKAKLENRAPQWLAGLGKLELPEPHPLFRLVPGPVADWEVRKQEFSAIIRG